MYFNKHFLFTMYKKKKKKGFTIASAFRKEKLRQRMKGSIISLFKCGILKYNIQSIFSKTFTPVMNADLSAKKKTKKRHYQQQKPMPTRLTIRKSQIIHIQKKKNIAYLF